jgi:ribosomal-protein-alanine N-acetyltransferase
MEPSMAVRQNTTMNSFRESELAMRETPCLHLRPPDSADLDFMVNLFARPELVAHRPDPEPDSPEASKARLERTIRHDIRNSAPRRSANTSARTTVG